jgi:translation initiation factor IF-1
MSKQDDVIKMTGVVTEVLRNTTYRVTLENMDKPVLATLNGRMRQFGIRVLLGDNVEVEVSVYDLGRGRIIRRH